MKDSFDINRDLARDLKILDLKEQKIKYTDLKLDQIKKLKDLIKALSFEDSTILMDKYIYKTGPEALEEIFSIEDAEDEFLYIRYILSRALGLEEEKQISDEDLETAARLVLGDQVEEIQGAENKKPSKTLKKQIKDLSIDTGRQARRVIKKAAAIILILSSIAGMFLATNAEARDKIYSWIIEDRGTYSIFKAEKPAIEEEILDIDDLKINYIPQGFELLEIQGGNEERIYQYADYKNNNLVIYFSEIIDNGTNYYNTEDAKIKDIIIAGHDGYYWEREDGNYLLWQQNGIECFISGSISREEIIKIGENISKK
ncbi:DUF4367 domain-containing protein [Neofamilia massiliensis]|uniref:DUF4367 domain-containing protein n=1 Tax=Neofamilia massiliensis TaxID=1673724 RepID=UPI0006BB655D|nr:DUF4367 domain-containing protein [Neofamilia massiliensis]